ncbi:MAG: type II secretion system F family protein [Candidatus Bathyarchaeota archaeon]|nr:type II secretion system F family protein [Candidatus Bathyarchaeota archaeon]
MKASEKIKTKLRGVFQTAKPKKQKKEGVSETGFERLNGTAYFLVGEKIGRALPIFRDLDSNLQKARLKINFKAYVSLTVFTTLIAAVSVGVVLPTLLWVTMGMPLLSLLLFGLGGALLAGSCSVVCFYFFPIYRADKHKHEVEDELPFTTGYMAILANAGVSPEKIFDSLATLKQPLAASAEAKDIVSHINLFGTDIISALEKASNRTPSEKFKEILEGIISTMHSGGNLAVFLRGKFTAYIKLRKLTLKKYADTLSMLAEVYVALLLTAPLLFVIMLSVMSVMGGGGVGGLSSDMLLRLITYVAIPFAAAVFLIVVDSTSPKW